MRITLELRGRIVEVGRMDTGQHGFVISLDDGRAADVLGLSEADCKQIAASAYWRDGTLVQITIDVKEPKT